MNIQSSICVYTYTAITINKISLTDDDFERLKNGGWLNCKVCTHVCMGWHFKCTYTSMHVVAGSLFFPCGTRMQQGTHMSTFPTACVNNVIIHRMEFKLRC